MDTESWLQLVQQGWSGGEGRSVSDGLGLQLQPSGNGGTRLRHQGPGKPAGDAVSGLIYPVWTMTVSVTAIFFNSLWGRPSRFIEAILSVGNPPAMTSVVKHA